jgi:hypothetical protein
MFIVDAFLMSMSRQLCEDAFASFTPICSDARERHDAFLAASTVFIGSMFSVNGVNGDVEVVDGYTGNTFGYRE